MRRTRNVAGPRRATLRLVPHPITYRLRMRNSSAGERNAWADLVRRIRKATGLTQVALANRLNVERTTILRWESGHQRPGSFEVVERFAELFQLDLVETLRAAGLVPEARGEPERDVIDPAVRAVLPDIAPLLHVLMDPDTDAATRAELLETVLRVVALARRQQRVAPPVRRRRPGVA